MAKKKTKKRKSVRAPLKVVRGKKKDASNKNTGYKLKKGPHLVYLALGSNVGDREEYIEQANFLLNKTKSIEVLKHSSNYETEAEGNTDQPAFMNSATLIKTTLAPDKLLKTLNEIEGTLGRERETEWGPRTIDIDILFYDDLIISDDKLQIPHPLLHDRVFVLKPLIEINPHMLHPVLEKTVQDLFDEKKSEQGETYDDELPGFKEIKTGTYDDYERW